jgi:hypothetical protein
MNEKIAGIQTFVHEFKKIEFIFEEGELSFSHFLLLAKLFIPG